MEEIIQLAPDDDITSIKTRLEWTEARRVLMIVPGKNKVLRSLVNQKVLARTADTLNIDLALVTQDSKIRDAAKQAGIRTFAAEWIAHKIGFISPVAEKAEPEKTTPPQLHLVETPPPPRVRIKNKKLVVVVGNGRIDFLQQVIGLIIAGMLALALVLLVLALAPAATVTLTPRVDEIKAEIQITADPAVEDGTIDTENNIIPARQVQAELTLSAEVETIKQEEAPVDQATGMVVMYNRTRDEQLIPISTTVRTSSGATVDFVTTQTATVPAGTGATVMVPVIAVEPGPQGNVPAGQINRFANSSLGLLVRVINESGTGGGSMRQAGVVTNQDKDRVRSKLRQLIQQKGYEEMLAGLDEQEFIPPETLLVIELDITYEQFSGDVSPVLGAEMHAVVRGTAIADYNANQLAYYALLKKVPFDKTLLPDGLKFNAGGIEILEDKKITFPVMVEGQIVSDINPETVREAITFMPIGEAQAWLSDNLPIISVPGVDVSPNWLGRLPVLADRIKVVVNEASAQTTGETP